MLPNYSLWRAQGRWSLACTAALAALLGWSAPAWSQLQDPQKTDPGAHGSGTLIGVVAADRHTAEIAVYAPEYSGSFLSLLVPGAGQMYAGNPVKAAVYLGLAGAAGASVYSLLMAGDSFVTPEEAAFAGLLGYGAALLVGGASMLDAMADITSRYQAADDALVPISGTETQSRPAGPRRRVDE